jgi:small conductance mechanosensitive channel
MTVEVLNIILQKTAALLQAQNLDHTAAKLILSFLVLAMTMLAAKIINIILNKVIEGKRQKSAGETGPVPGNMLLSAGILLKAMVLYGGLFAAAVVILEIFEVDVVSSDDIKNIGLMVLKIIGIVIAAKLAVNFGRLAVTQVFARKEIKEGFIEKRRAKTLESLLKNVITYVVFFLAGLTILQIFNVNTSAILAGAGILGLAVGFGAQNLVKDIISGFFILFEDQFAVGDYVEAGGAVGMVEEIGLRTCKIRQWTGQLHIIPNGEISNVTNYNRGHMMAVAVVGIAYEEDVDRAIEVLRRECEAVHREIPSVVEVPVVQGVVALADFSVNIRTVAPTLPGEQWAVERELLRRFKNALGREGIEIPYPRRVITYREEYGQEENTPTNQPE